MLATNTPYHMAETSTAESIALEDITDRAVGLGVECWKKWRGARRFPSKDDLQPRDIAPALRHMILTRVIDGGTDFENRIVGDAQVRAFAIPMQHRRLSDVGAAAPGLRLILQRVLMHVAQHGEPLAIRGRVGRDIPQANFTDTEAAFLPFGATDDAVDHIAIFNSYVMRGVLAYGM